MASLRNATPSLATPPRLTLAALAFACLAMVCLATTAQAEHGDWLLGTCALNGASQAPEGFYYQNLWSYYSATASKFVQTGPLKTGPRGNVSLGLNFSGTGRLDLFVDQNTVGYTTPLKILGANYGFNITIPFAIAAASGAASLQPVLSLPRSTVTLPSQQSSGGTTKGSLGDIYVEPINLGWHFNYLDLIVSSGFFAPTGPYNSQAQVNIGFGHWTGVFGLGGVVYADTKHTWALSIYSHYLLYGSQMGRHYKLGNVMPFEWGMGKTFNLNQGFLKQITIGAVGYAQWQVSKHQIFLTPTTPSEASAVNRMENTWSQVYAAGPAITVLTKYGLLSLRYYEEFAARATPSGRQLMFGVFF